MSNNKQFDYIKLITNSDERRIHPPSSGFGEQRIIWKDGQILDIITEERTRIKK